MQSKGQSEPLVSVDVKTFTYEGSDRPALSDIALNIERGAWISVVGPSGSGKSTLCGLIAGVLQRLSGDIEGEVTGLPNEQLGQVGLVFQDPDLGLIHSHVEDELSFAPENLRVPPHLIEQRMSEALKAVGMPEQMRYRKTSELSGGQKQRIAIAAMLTMQPQLIILDESTVHLDDEGTNRLYETIHALHESGHTIVTTSSRWEDQAKPDQVVVLDQGRIVATGSPEQVRGKHAVRLQQLGVISNRPSDSKQTYEWLAGDRKQLPDHDAVVTVDNVSFSYGANEAPIFEELSFQLPKYALLAILGPNGAGKTTLGRLLVGLAPYEQGSIKVRGQELSSLTVQELARTVGYIFQNPDHQFVANTVWEECKFGNDESDERLLELLEQFALADVKDHNPYQLNLFQKRKLNLLTASLTKPSLIVLDEPTAGLNYLEADELVSYCTRLAREGTAIVFITHDVWAIQHEATHMMKMTPRN